MGGRSSCLLGLSGAGEGDSGERPEHLLHPFLVQQRGLLSVIPVPQVRKGLLPSSMIGSAGFLYLPSSLIDKPVLELSVSTSIPEHPFRPRRPLQCFAVTRALRRFPGYGSRLTLPAPPSLSRASPYPLAPRPAPISPAAPVCRDAPDTSGSRPPGRPPRTGSDSARVPAARPPLAACFREPSWLVAAAMIAPSRDGARHGSHAPSWLPALERKSQWGLGCWSSTLLPWEPGWAGTIGSSSWPIPAGSSGMKVYFPFSSTKKRKGAGSPSEPADTTC